MELREISDKARNKKLKPSDMQGGCMSAEMKPVWNGTEFEPKLMCPLSLSYDHRVIDGADGARFITYVSHLLADARRLLL